MFSIWKSINVLHCINRIKDKNHMTISIDGANAFDKTQYSFLIKTLNEPDTEGNFLNLISETYRQHHT